MRKLNRVLLSMAVWLACAPRYIAGVEAQKSEDTSAEQQSFVSENKPLPATILAFQKLDFDGRMERQEYLRQKYQANLFIDALRHHILENDVMIWDNRMMRSMEMAYLGREADAVPQGISVRGAMELCGLKRLAAFHKFKAKYPNRPFLKDKNDFYRGGLNAEMEALNEIGMRFDLGEWIAFKQMVREENQVCSVGRDRSAAMAYHNEMIKRAQTRLQHEHMSRYSREL